MSAGLPYSLCKLSRLVFATSSFELVTESPIVPARLVMPAS